MLRGSEVPAQNVNVKKENIMVLASEKTGNLSMPLIKHGKILKHILKVKLCYTRF